MKAETRIQAEIMLRLNSRKDCRVFRNNVGFTRTQDGRPLAFGLAKGSGDLIGFFRGPDGRATFLSIEVKSPTGIQTPHQKSWMDFVNRFGGCAFVARSADEAEQLLPK